MKLNKIARPALLAALIAASGSTSAVTWDFQTSPPANHTWGVFQSFDSNPASGDLIYAYGYDTAGLGTALFSKWSGAGSDETGLGLANVDPDGAHEIPPGASIVLDMGLVAGALGNTYTISLGSLQFPPQSSPAENANIYECKDSKCSLKNLLGTISGPPTINSGTFTLDIADGYHYFQVWDNPAGGGEDVLIDSIRSVDSVPEPATLGLLGLGLAGLGFTRRRKAS
jgi:PEP-CTERM motif